MERFFDDLGGEVPPADVDEEGGAGFGVGGGEVGHADAGHEGGGEGAAGEFADGRAVGGEDRVVGAGRGAFSGGLDGGEFEFRAIFLLAGENFATGEGAFGEIDEEAEPGFDGGAVWREVVAVERVGHFEAEGVAGTETGGGGAGGEEVFPDGDASGGGAEEFEAILAGVAGAADDGSVGEGGDAIAWREGLAGAGLGEDGGRLRALDGHAGPGVAFIFEGDARDRVGLHPGEVLVDHRGVDDEEEVVRAGAVGDEVVDDAAALVEHQGVMAVAWGEGEEVVGEEGIEPPGGGFATDDELAHVGDVEDPAVVADGVVFLEDRLVLDGHVPAGEGDEAGAEGEVGAFQRAVFEVGRHAAERGVRARACQPARRGGGSARMLFLDRLEPRFRWLAFPGFLRSFAILHVLVFAVQIIKPGFGANLVFDLQAIKNGEYWRVVTFLFAGTGFEGARPLGLIFFIFLIRILFMMSDALEAAWGVFRTSFFCYTGVGFMLVVNTVYGGHAMDGIHLYFSAFFAFATLFPRTEFRVALLIPVEARWIALLMAVIPAYDLLKGPFLLPAYLLVYLNYLLWAGIPALKRRKVAAAAKTRLRVLQRRGQFEKAKKGGGVEAFHECAVCGRTDESDPQLEFRVGADGREYCDEHLAR